MSCNIHGADDFLSGIGLCKICVITKADYALEVTKNPIRIAKSRAPTNSTKLEEANEKYHLMSLESSNRPTFSTIGTFYLVPTKFIFKYQHAISIGLSKIPTHINTKDLLCDGSKCDCVTPSLLFPFYGVALDPIFWKEISKNVFMVTEKEIDILRKERSMDAEITVSIRRGKQDPSRLVYSHNIDICEKQSFTWMEKCASQKIYDLPSHTSNGSSVSSSSGPTGSEFSPSGSVTDLGSGGSSQENRKFETRIRKNVPGATPYKRQCVKADTLRIHLLNGKLDLETFTNFNEWKDKRNKANLNVVSGDPNYDKKVQKQDNFLDSFISKFVKEVPMNETRRIVPMSRKSSAPFCAPVVSLDNNPDDSDIVVALRTMSLKSLDNCSAGQSSESTKSHGDSQNVEVEVNVDAHHEANSTDSSQEPPEPINEPEPACEPMDESVESTPIEQSPHLEIRGRATGEEGQVSPLLDYHSHDIYLWSKVWQLQNAKEKDRPLLFEFGAFSFIKSKGKNNVAIPCSADGKSKPILDELPLEHDWIMIPFEIRYDKRYRPDNERFPRKNNCGLYVVDRALGVTYICDSNTDLEQALINNQRKHNPIELPGKRTSEWKGMRRKHKERQDQISGINKRFKSHILDRFEEQTRMKYIGRLFLCSAAHGSHLAFMMAVNLLYNEKCRPSTKEELQKLQTKWSKLPSVGVFWHGLKIEIEHYRRKRESLHLQKISRDYMLGHKPAQIDEPELPPPPFTQYFKP